MIRFSAALVAVAIGVLIGGIATSKLLLVYIAIVVSAVALLALAVGVVLKREELFGEAQGLVPAGAGAAPVQPARTGESQDQPKPVASVPPPAPFQGPAAGYGSAFAGTSFAGTSQAAPPAPAANPSAPHQAPGGPGRDRVADPAPPWEAQSARDQWSSSPMPGSTTADPAPDWMTSGRTASDPVGQAAPTAPSPTVAPAPAPPTAPSPTVSPAPAASAAPTAPSPVPPLSSGPSSAGPEPASPNWFAPRARPAEAAPAAPQAPADPVPADEDDDWPARYSWLGDEAEEGPGGKGLGGAPADQAAGAAVGDYAGPEATALAGQGQDPAPGAAIDDGPAGDTRASDPARAEAAVPVAADAGQEPGPGETEPGDAGVSAGREPPPADAQDPASGDDLVAVLRGVPRYHQPDCVLIRFMPEGDVQRMPAGQAKADGCTPCAACQPAG